MVSDPHIRSLLEKLVAEDEPDSVSVLLAGVLAEMEKLNAKLDEAEQKKSGGGGGRSGGGIGNGRFATFRDIVVLVLIPIAFALAAFVFDNTDRLARLESKCVTEAELQSLELRAREERMQQLQLLREELRRHEDREMGGNP